MTLETSFRNPGLLNSQPVWRDLTSDEISAFQRDGVLCLRDLYSPEWVTMLTKDLASIMTEAPFSSNTKIKGGLYKWMTYDGIRDLVLFGPTAKPVMQAMGSQSLRFFHDQIFIKDRMLMEATPWHHDYTFWPLEGNQIASVWTSLDAVTAETSALEFVAGSHLWPQRFRAVGLGNRDVSTRPLDELPDIEADRSSFNILSWDLNPGDALLFHALTVHGSRGNSSVVRMRRAITTRWTGDNVIFKEADGLPFIFWEHGLKDGDFVSGPLFPQIYPGILESEVSARMRGPIPPDPARFEAFKRKLQTYI